MIEASCFIHEIVHIRILSKYFNTGNELTKENFLICIVNSFIKSIRFNLCCYFYSTVKFNFYFQPYSLTLSPFLWLTHDNKKNHCFSTQMYHFSFDSMQKVRDETDCKF